MVAAAGFAAVGTNAAISTIAHLRQRRPRIQRLLAEHQLPVRAWIECRPAAPRAFPTGTHPTPAAARCTQRDVQGSGVRSRAVCHWGWRDAAHQREGRRGRRIGGGARRGVCVAVNALLPRHPHSVTPPRPLARLRRAGHGREPDPAPAQPAWAGPRPVTRSRAVAERRHPTGLRAWARAECGGWRNPAAGAGARACSAIGGRRGASWSAAGRAACGAC